MYSPAIIVVAYNRLKPLERLLKSIQEAVYSHDNITLIISIDYEKHNDNVVEIADKFQWNYGSKLVKRHSCNLGLKKHIIECGDYTNEYGSIILLEDDLYVSPYYYEYAEKALTRYGEDERIAGIALYSHEWNGYANREFMPIYNGYDVYFGQFSVTWGQAWTKKQWKLFKDFFNNNKILEDDFQIPGGIWKWKKSWSKFFVYYIKHYNKYFVMPFQAMSTCFSEPGVHSGMIDTRHQVNISMGKRDWRFPDFECGLHYNLFFENEDLYNKLPGGIDRKELCIDLYGIQNKFYKCYRYVVSPHILNQKIVKSYGMEMRPLDLNIWCEIEGKHIFLYDMKTKMQNPYKNKLYVLDYIMSGRNWNLCLAYGTKEFVRLSLNKVRKCMKRNRK